MDPVGVETNRIASPWVDGLSHPFRLKKLIRSVTSGEQTTNDGVSPKTTNRTTAMKPKLNSIARVAIASLVVILPAGTNAALPPPLPEADPDVPPIVEILPPEASAGQTIIVRTQLRSRSTSTLNNSFNTIGQVVPSFQPFPTYDDLKLPKTYIPGLPLATPRIYFCGPNYPGPRVPGENVTALGNNRYRVTVPRNARSGQLRFETSAGNSYSTVNLTVVSTGYSIVNFSQFDVVSIRVDNIERLAGQEIPATLPSNPDVFLADVGATQGNHSMQITLGPSASQPVITYFLASVAATNPFNEIQVGIMGVGEYFVASPNATVSGNNVTASWQTLFINPDATLLVNGFDFTHNTSTGVTTWANWNFDRTGVVASGTVAEPESWPLNPTTLTLELRRNNGSFWTNVDIDFLNKSFVADDEFTYELQ
jgi:hypothetical protein